MHQESGVGTLTEEVLECFNIPCASGHFGTKVTCKELPNQPASSLPVVLLCHKSSPRVEKATSEPTNQLSGYQASAAFEICTFLYASAQYRWEICRCIQAGLRLHTLLIIPCLLEKLKVKWPFLSK